MRILKSILDFFDSVARARAARELVRAGNYEAARNLFAKDKEKENGIYW